MSHSRDDERHQADLEWLYAERRSSADRTRIMDQAEQAELDRRAATARARAARPPESDWAVASSRRLEESHRRASAAASSTSSRSYSRPESRSESRPESHPARPASSQQHAKASRRSEAGGGAAASGRAGVARGRRRRRLHPLRWLVVLVLVGAAWLVWVPLHALGQVARVDDVPDGDRPAQQPGTAVLIVGSDSRADLSASQRSELGTGMAEGQRTDTMMILYTPPQGKSVIVGLPRDSYLPIPGHNKNKLNAAYSLGGAPLLIQTVEHNTGLRIDGYVEIGFDGFVNLTDAVGGVRMCLDQPMKDKDSHTDLPTGCQTLDGVNALGYVRMRKADPQGDIGRMKRQREFLAALVKQAARPATILNPWSYWDTTHSVASAISLGSSTDTGTVLAMARGMYSISKGDGVTLSVPIADANATTAAGSSVLWDDQQAAELFGLLKSGSTDGVERFAS